MADAFDFTLTKDNPNPSLITDAMWWLWLQLHALEPKDTALGGIYASKSGYHNTRANNERNWPHDYSIRDKVDQEGPADKAAAIDWTFWSAQQGDYKNISKYFRRFMNAARARDPRLAGWREAYGQEDTDLDVEGWDCRYNRAVTSDKSHLWHLHFSETRKYVESFHNKACLLSVLIGESLQFYLDRGGKLVTGEAPLEPTPKKPQPKHYDLGARVLRMGASGADVRKAQERLNVHGANPRLVVDGIFGPKTDRAVRDFQRKRKLVVDGIVGPQTVKALKAAPPKPKPSGKLVVDGRLGPKTIARWQQVMGTPVDGRITEPSPLVRAVQRHLNHRVGANLRVDGRGIRQDGRAYQTVRALQRYLGTPQDGVMSTPISVVVKALQRRLNTGRF